MFTHNTSDVVARMAETTGLTKGQADIAVKALVAIITDAAIQREAVKLTNLGVFKTAERKARVGRNPLTGEPVEIPAKVVMVFRPTKHLRDI